MATKRIIWNGPFIPRDVTITNKILGPSVYGLKGKRTRKTNDPVQTEALVPIPKTIEEHYMKITIVADVLYVNQNPSFSTISRGLQYGTISVLLSMKVNDLESALLGVIHSYSLHGFTVKHVLVEIQFECLKSRISQHNFFCQCCLLRWACSCNWTFYTCHQGEMLCIHCNAAVWSISTSTQRESSQNCCFLYQCISLVKWCIPRVQSSHYSGGFCPRLSHSFPGHFGGIRTNIWMHYW